MQDVPEGFDLEWIRMAKKCIQCAKVRVSAREEYLEALLSEIEALAAEKFQVEFLKSETDEI